MILQEVRSVLRMMGRRPGGSFVVVASLALAMGASTTVFGLVDAVLLEPLPYAQPERIVAIWEGPSTNPGEKWRVSPFSFRQWREQNVVFERMALFGGTSVTLIGDEPVRLNGSVVTEDFFPLLGIEALLGRVLQAEDFAPGGEPAAVISHALWQDRLGGDPGVIGEFLRLDGDVLTIVGVLPPRIMPLRGYTPGRIDFGSGEPFFWIPLSPFPDHFGHVFGALATLREGVGIEEARGSMRMVSRRLEKSFPDSNAGLMARVSPLRDEVVGDVSSALWILLAAVGLVVLIASTNVSSAMLVRAEERSGEFAIRSALGSGSIGIARLIGIEGLVYVTLGALAGLPLAFFALRALPGLIPLRIPRLDEASLDGSTLGVTLAVCAISGLVCGLVPVLRSSRRDPAPMLQGSGHGVPLEASAGASRRLLVASEVALALVLVVTSGLLARSFQRLMAVDLGFEERQALVLKLENPSARYPEMHSLTGFHDELLDRVGGLPGVLHVAAAYDHPMDTDWWQGFLIEGAPPPDPDSEPNALFRTVTPGYFEALGTPLLAGRGFREADDASSPGVVIINEELARQYFAGGEPVGRHLRIQTVPWIWGDAIPDRFRIVGVARNVRFGGRDKSPTPAFYVPYRQAPHHHMELIVRTAGDPMAMLGAVRNELKRIDASLPIARVRTLAGLVDESVSRPRFVAVLIGLLGAFSLGLALIGVWGGLSQVVRQRRREIGVRMALGATPAEVFRYMMGRGLGPALWGAAAGALVSLASGRMLRSVLFEISPLDATTHLASAALLLGAACLACAAPALRAARMDPVKVLRAE